MFLGVHLVLYGPKKKTRSTRIEHDGIKYIYIYVQYVVQKTGHHRKK
jgi:hypothetical protein